MAGLVPAISLRKAKSCSPDRDRRVKPGDDNRNEMPPDFYFALTLIVKMAVTAGFVLAATAAAERAGPLVGGLVASLPLGAGPVYVFLALDHDAHFIAASAVGSLAINNVNVIFAMVYAKLAQRRSLSVSLSVAMITWFVLAAIVNWINWTLATALISNIVIVGACIALSKTLRHTPIPRVHVSWYEHAIRAVLVAALVGIVVSLSFRIGPGGSGILAVFPMILIGVIVILHRRAGGPPSAAVIANAIVGLTGFACASVMLHFPAEPLGSPIALVLALSTSLAWGLLVYGARRRGVTL